MAQFLISLTPLLAGGVIFAIFLGLGGWLAAVGVIVAAPILALGLRSSIRVSQEEVQIVRKWFFIPYWRYRAAEIQDVWYGGDWGDPEGAMGVVVKLGSNEVHIGTSKNMHELHNALFRLSARHREMNAAAAGAQHAG